MRLAVRPFAVASEDSVRFVTAWHEIRGERTELLGESIKDWDYLTVLTLHAELEVDVAAARRSAHLTANSGLAVVLSAASSATRLRGPVWAENVSAPKKQHLRIEVDIAGSELGGRLDLITQLVVSRPEPLDELGPTHRGAIIWRHRHSVLLEGDAPQFPTEPADLSGPPYNLPRAAWLLEIASDDLDVPAAAAVRLVVNEAHPLMRRVLDGDASPEAVQALETVRWDVARQLVDAALALPEFIERDDAFEEDSFGWLLAGVLATHFPGESPRSVRTIRDTQRARYEAALQDAARILG